MGVWSGCACGHEFSDHRQDLPRGLEFPEAACQVSDCYCTKLKAIWICPACGSEHDSEGAAGYCHYGCVGAM